jgi:hypothetical protein
MPYPQERVAAPLLRVGYASNVRLSYVFTPVGQSVSELTYKELLETGVFGYRYVLAAV